MGPISAAETTSWSRLRKERFPKCEEVKPGGQRREMPVKVRLLNDVPIKLAGYASGDPSQNSSHNWNQQSAGNKQPSPTP